MQFCDKLYINGQWTAPQGSKSIDVISASTEAVMGKAAAANRHVRHMEPTPGGHILEVE